MSFRQLAAIMFTDIVGYTQLMGEDEMGAFNLLRKNRQIQQPLIRQFNGSLIKELGDGVLATFHTATDAVQCGIAIQQACKGTDLRLRIGIHIGDVLFEDGDVFSDGVNIASRIQALAPICGIWITEPVYKNISNKKDIRATFVGEESLKNVKEQVRVYEVEISEIPDADHSMTHALHSELNKANREKSVAVLPFVNMSNDPEQEYFGDGVAEEIINSLVHIKELKVAGRMSSFQYKGAKADIREVGEKLGVSTVLEGSIRKQNDRVRISVQLINVDNGFHLWSETFDRTLDDIFAIQEEIALAITEKLKVTLVGAERERINRAYTQNTEAYELYLKGRFYINRRGASIITGLQCFQRAIGIDPEFSLAYTGVADANLLIATYGLARPTEILQKAKEAADMAISIDPTLCEPYCTLGYYYVCFERNWKSAKTNFLQALEINPRYTQAHYWYGWNFLSWIDAAFDEAEKHGKMALKLEPLNSICYGHMSLILTTAGKLEEALQVARAGLELDSQSFLCQMNEGTVNMYLENFEEATRCYEAAIDISGRHPFPVCCMACNYSRAGEAEKANLLMEELITRSATEYVAWSFLGLAASHVRTIEVTLEYLRKAAEEREPLLLALKNENWLPITLRQDPRFYELLVEIGYPSLTGKKMEKAVG